MHDELTETASPQSPRQLFAACYPGVSHAMQARSSAAMEGRARIGYRHADRQNRFRVYRWQWRERTGHPHNGESCAVKFGVSRTP
jgi:hypothetical protein